jgi:hypothetical protein
MNRWMTKICAAGVLAGTSLSLGSCAHNDDMLVIVGAMFAQAPDCSYQPSATSKLLLTGVVDLGFGANYTAVLLVANQLAARGSKDRLRAESSNVTINNAQVRLLSNGTDEIKYFSVPASGYIIVGSGQDSGYGAISVDVLPGGIPIDGTQTQYIVAEIRVQGTTLGGASIDSNLFRFEIFVVNSSLPNGGLVTYDQADPQTGECNANTCGATNQTQTSCYLGQDSFISCCNCSQSFCRQQP